MYEWLFISRFICFVFGVFVGIGLTVKHYEEKELLEKEKENGK